MQKTLEKTDFFEQIVEREKFLSSEIIKRKKRICKAPEGDLKIISKGARKQYYRRLKGETNGTYIHKSDIGLIRSLAQKRYDMKFVAAAEAELKPIRSFLKKYNSKTREVSAGFPIDIKDKLDLAEMTDEEFSESWQKMAFVPKPIKEGVPFHITMRGERVRSKSEELIANALFSKKIPYRYECPVMIYTGELRYPDFTILNPKTRRVVFLEHLGKVDDPQYVSKNLKKLRDYEESGIFLGEELLVTAETEEIPLNSKIIEKFIAKHFGR